MTRQRETVLVREHETPLRVRAVADPGSPSDTVGHDRTSRGGVVSLRVARPGRFDRPSQVSGGRTPPVTLRRRLAEVDALWERHANPASGWSRLLATPLLLIAVYARDRRLVALALAWTAVNPVAFPPVERGTDPAWMTRVVDAERAWLRGEVTPGAYGRLDAASGPVFAYALYAAVRRRPLRAAVAGLVSMGLKLAFVAGLVRRHRSGGGGNEPSGRR